MWFYHGRCGPRDERYDLAARSVAVWESDRARCVKTDSSIGSPAEFGSFPPVDSTLCMWNNNPDQCQHCTSDSTTNRGRGGGSSAPTLHMVRRRQAWSFVVKRSINSQIRLAMINFSATCRLHRINVLNRALFDRSRDLPLAFDKGRWAQKAIFSSARPVAMVEGRFYWRDYV